MLLLLNRPWPSVLITWFLSPAFHRLTHPLAQLWELCPSPSLDNLQVPVGWGAAFSWQSSRELEVYPASTWPPKVRAHGCPCQTTPVPCITPEPHVPVHWHWKPPLFPPGTLNFQPQTPGLLPFHMSPAPGQGLPGPNWASLGNDSDHKKPRVPWPDQVSHKIWILPYGKFKLRQENNQQSKKKRIYLLPEDNTPLWTGYAKTTAPSLPGSKVKPEDDQRNGYNLSSLCGGESEEFL